LQEGHPDQIKTPRHDIAYHRYKYSGIARYPRWSRQARPDANDHDSKREQRHGVGYPFDLLALFPPRPPETYNDFEEVLHPSRKRPRVISQVQLALLDGRQILREKERPILCLIA
jgi:hypothetical protein